ncbi:protease pro-enzyme activation domain-containing protein [Acidicapsa ligni]|uniref:protease pro-enzyme activation domain-containing protein n=1 Tax=Acidicapsa ligni TaxID=542300 RepID=UPI0021DF7973|nr:protease pro-enzyme activation domain-containing protein [Acidicapsa ligni]
MKPIPFRALFLRLCLGTVFVATTALAQSNAPDSQTVRPPAAQQDRVRGPVKDEQRTVLTGQTRRMDHAAVDLGEVSPSLSTGRMVLWLRRSADQQAHLGQFFSQVQDPKSANYRHWLTPASYGAAYGVSDNDLAAVEQWLKASGLKVEKIAEGRNAILFSGTAGDLTHAFHTSIHRYTIGQQRHLANANDPEVPTALAPVIAGISPMNDFRAKPLHVLRSPARYDAASHRMQPALTGGSNGDYALYVTPADASIIYDTPNKNFNAAATQTLDGSGVTIGIVGYSALAMADVQNYRTAFLPASAASNLPTQILDGGIDPGVLDGDTASEGLLDVEIAGGLAPGATIDYYYADSTDLSDGLVLAGLRALEDNKVNILSASYGECESDLGLGGNLEWSELWQQAAAQGISVTVSTGDSGSASCDTSVAPLLASHGLSVSGLSSTPYNIAVGGTDYYSLVNNFSNYVNTASSGNYPYYATALGYIPENPWNDSSSVVGNSFTLNMPTYDGVGDTNIIAAGGGLSSQAVCLGYLTSDGSCSQTLSGYTQPPYQTGFQQVNLVRSVPDVSLLAANGFYGAAWVFCSDSTIDEQGGVYTDCQSDASGHLLNDTPIGLIGGTSAAAPAFAGMLAMISQSQGGARLGQADTVLYNLAQDYNPSTSSPGKYQRAFHDVVMGNNSVYCASGSLNCGTNNFLEGYNATPSYDMASGLGSIDLSQLVNLWTATNFTSTTNTLTAGISSDPLSSAPISVVHGTPINFSTLVTPATATGQFSIVSTNSMNAASYSDFGALDGTGTGNLTTNDLPGGTYTVYAYYAGDTSHTGSQSSSGINVTISAESSTTTLSFGTNDPITYAIKEGVSSVAYGMGTYANAQPFGNSSTVDYTGTLLPDGIATGSVNFTSSNGVTQSAAINSLGFAQLSISSLAPGTYTYKASYPGDSSFATSASTSQTLTVTKGTTSFQLQPSATAVSPVGQVTVTAILQTDSIALYPTGSVSAQANGHTYPPTSSLQGSSNGAVANLFTFTIPTSDLMPGSNLVSVSYGGDTNYQSTSGSFSVTSTGNTGSFTLSGPSQPLVVEASQQSSTTISVASLNGFTGQVELSCAVSAAPSGHTPICQAATATVYGSFGASSIVSVATYADTPIGNYTITVTGVSGQLSQSVQIPLRVTKGPGFTLSFADRSISLSSPGKSASEALSITPIEGFTGTVTLNCIVAPTPTSGKAPTCALPDSINLGSSPTSVTLQIASDSTTLPGSYTVAVTAVSGGVQQTLALPLVLQQLAVTPGFDMSAASGTVSIALAGQSVTDMLSIRPAGGFTGAVQLSCAVSGGSSSSAAPTCTVPATASVTGTAVVNAMLTVNTAAPTTNVANDTRMAAGKIGGVVFGCLLIFIAPKRRKWTALGVLLVAACAMAVTACGGNGHSNPGTGGSPGTPTGSYMVKVTASSGSISATTQVNVSVQ